MITTIQDQMATSPNKVSQFWQELKRRRVIKAIAMYAATAFIILEVVDIVLPRLGLPDWTVTFIIILLIAGFPVSIIFSWIFDVTRQGIKKTEPNETAREEESIQVPARRRLRLSDGIIAVLFIAVCILLYPKIFKPDKFKDLRDEEGRISVAVMPFQNMTGDTTWDIWQSGIQNELITKLSNSTELSVRTYQTINDILQSTQHANFISTTPFVASDISRKLEANTFIQGSIKKSGGIIRINAQLIDSKTEEIYQTCQIDGNTEDDMFIIIDSLSRIVRSHMEIKTLNQKLDYDLGKFSTTDSPEAYRLFIQGMNRFFYSTDPSDQISALELFNKALEIDTNFTAARIFLIIVYHESRLYEESELCFQKAINDFENVSYDNQLLLKYAKSIFDKDPYAGIRHIGLLLEDDPQRRVLWHLQGANYYNIHQAEKAVQCFEKALAISEQWGVLWKWVTVYVLAGESYHALGNHVREKEILELGLDALPDNSKIVGQQAICALSQGDAATASDYIKKYRSIGETKGWNEDRINYSIGCIYQGAKQFNKAIEIFRDLIAKNPQVVGVKYRLGFILIDNEIDVDEGLELINQNLKIDPDNYYYVNARGWALYKQGKLDESLDILKALWEARPTYNHRHYLHIHEVKQALAIQNQ